MRARRPLCLLVLALGLAAGCGACTGDEPDALPAPHPAPIRAIDCIDLPAVDGDPGIVFGSDWSGEQHDFGETVVVHACTDSSNGRVSVVADGTGITVSPRSVRLDLETRGVVPFRVTVSEGASGGLRVTQVGGGGGAEFAGPVVVVDGEGWHFGRR